MEYSALQHNNTLNDIERLESNAKTYARTFNRVMQRGALATVWDVEGREYIDCLACAGALPLGHNHPVITEVVSEFIQSGHVLQGLDLPTVAKHNFLQELTLALPENFAQNMRVQFCGPTGSDAVEAALKLFKTVTQRRSIIAFHGAYHGQTLGSLALMGNLGPKQAITGFAGEVHFFPYPHSARCPWGVGGEQAIQIALHHLDHVLSDPESGITPPAMIILEAIQGEGGCIPAPPSWLRGLQEIANKHDIPLVIDEVQTGFGRTGTMFAFEEAGIVPDAIILSKALGGGFPMALVAYHSRYDTWKPGAHTGTFRGNQIAFVSGAASTRYIREHNLAGQAREKGAFLQHGLHRLAKRYPCSGEIRGRGLMVGAEIICPTGQMDTLGRPQLNGELARAIRQACFIRGLIIETGGRQGAILRFLPALVITEAELDRALSILAAAIDACLEPANRTLAALSDC